MITRRLSGPLSRGLSDALTLSKGGGAFSPLMLGTSALAWWSADYAASLTLNSNKVITWADRIGGIAPTQGTDANRPTYSETSYGGAPSLSLNGTSQFLTIANQPLPSGDDPCEIWAVLQQDALVGDTTTRRAFAYGGTSNNDSRQLQRAVVSGNNRADMLIGTGAGTVGSSRPSIDFSGKHVARVVVDGTTATTYVDGLPGVVQTVTPATGTTRITIGAVLTGSGLWNGQIRDIVVTSILSEQQTFQMWQWALDQALIGRSGMNNWIWSNGDSFSIEVSGDGLVKRLVADGYVATVGGEGGSTLAGARDRVLARPWLRNTVLAFCDGSPNGSGLLDDDMAMFAQIVAAVPKTIIIEPVRRPSDTAGVLASVSALQVALAATYPTRLVTMQAALAAAATSPGDDADVAANVVPRSLLFAVGSNEHLNTAGWNVAYPRFISVKNSLGY